MLSLVSPINIKSCTYILFENEIYQPKTEPILIKKITYYSERNVLFILPSLPAATATKIKRFLGGFRTPSTLLTSNLMT